VSLRSDHVEDAIEQGFFCSPTRRFEHEVRRRFAEAFGRAVNQAPIVGLNVEIHQLTAGDWLTTHRILAAGVRMPVMPVSLGARAASNASSATRRLGRVASRDSR
jgi:hypothetical protein